MSLTVKTLIACIGSALIAIAPSQQAQQPAPDSPIFSTQTSVVIVPALVREASGETVFTLAARDFVLTDNGVRQPLRIQSDTGSEPLALVVVLEVSATGAREFDKLSSLVPMLESVVGQVPHRIALVAFSKEAVLVQGFTPRAEDAAGALTQLMANCSQDTPHDNCATEAGEDKDGGNQAAIIDSIGFGVDLLRHQPSGFRRAILLISETLDRGSHLTLENAVRAVTETDTTIFAVGFSTAKSQASHFAYHNLPIRRGFAFSNKYPNPPHGCMGSDLSPDPEAPRNGLTRLYDCIVQLAPPLGIAKMAAIATSDALQRNVPETVAQLTGGEYFKLTDSRSLERSLATIANHIPNRYILSFQPHSPAPGLHVISLRLPKYEQLRVAARTAYWVDPEMSSSPAPPH